VDRQDPPWKVVRAFPNPDGGLLLHLHNVSGGVLAGDRLALNIDVAAGAVAQVTTTGAGRLYRHRAGVVDSEQRTRISVGEGAILEYLPDAVIPYAGARHVQSTEVRLNSGAALFWWEILAPGRQAAGEKFAFDRLRFENRVFSGTHLVLLENFAVEPAARSPRSVARLGPYAWVSSFCICQEGRPPAFWRDLEDHLNNLASQLTRPAEAIWGASMLARDGIVVRGLSATGRFLHPALLDFWRAARWILTGKPAIPPRKVY